MGSVCVCVCMLVLGLHVVHVTVASRNVTSELCTGSPDVKLGCAAETNGAAPRVLVPP